jgi:hypothetical protein
MDEAVGRGKAQSWLSRGTKKISLVVIMFDLAPHRVRLRTTWRFTGTPSVGAGISAPVEDNAVKSDAADLHFRGFSKLAKSMGLTGIPTLIGWLLRNRSARFDRFITRFGDVQELRAIDGRYVIANAEMRCHFDSPSKRRHHQVGRDFVIIIDGWIKTATTIRRSQQYCAAVPRKRGICNHAGR